MLSLPATIRLNSNTHGNGFSFGPLNFSTPPEVEAEIQITTPFCSKHLQKPDYPGGRADAISCECRYEEIDCNRLGHRHDCRCGEGHTCSEGDYSCRNHLPSTDDHPLEQLAKLTGHPSNLRDRLKHLEEEENADLRERLDELEARLAVEFAE